jgi:molybdopterin synthase sulfur carrier subunit
MRILAFGIAKEILGSGSIDMVIDHGTTVDALKVNLAEQYPNLKKLSSFMVAVNNEYASGGHAIVNGDEIAIIPPVSGG